MKSQNIMSGVGNTATGATIFTDNTVSGGPNDVSVSNLVVEQDMRVDGNFEVGTFSIDDLTVNNDLNVTDDLTVGGNVQADYVETTTSVNVHGSLFLDNNIVGNGLSYDRPLKRLRVDNGTDVTDVLSNAVSVTNGAVTNTHDHNKITIANTGSTRVGHMHLTGTELEVGTTTNHPVEILVNNAPVATAQTNGCVRIGPGASLGDVAGARLLLANEATALTMTNQGTIANESVYPLAVLGKTRRFIISAGDTGDTLYVGSYQGGLNPNPRQLMTFVNDRGVRIGPVDQSQASSTRTFVVTGTTTINDTTTSTSTTTGALVCGGGVGVAGSVNAGSLATSGSINTSSTTASTSTTTGALVVAGGAGINGVVNAGTLRSTFNVECNGLSTFTGQSAVRIDRGTTTIATVGAGANASNAVTFNTTFLTTPSVTATVNTATAGGTSVTAYVSGPPSTTGCSVGVRNYGTGAATNVVIAWIAIG